MLAAALRLAAALEAGNPRDRVNTYPRQRLTVFVKGLPRRLVPLPLRRVEWRRWADPGLVSPLLTLIALGDDARRRWRILLIEQPGLPGGLERAAVLAPALRAAAARAPAIAVRRRLALDTGALAALGPLRRGDNQRTADVGD